MTKGELRQARKAARAAGQDWRAAQREDGAGFEQVRQRTPVEERAHERRMERWARRIDDDPDWR